MDMNTLTTWVRQNAVIESNHYYAIVTVDFSNTITEWFDPMELAEFVAELFPLRDWMDIGYDPEEDYFQVSLWWASDEYIEACKQSGNDEDELPLTPELVRNSVVIEDDAVMEFKIDWKLSRIYGEKELADFIAEQFPGWEVPEIDGYSPGTTTDGAHVYQLWRSSSEEKAAA